MPRAPSLTLVPREDLRRAASAHAQAATQSWLEAWRDAATLGWDVAGRLAALYDPRRVRAWLLADLNQLSVDAMRSPEFLSFMRFNLALLAPWGR